MVEKVPSIFRKLLVSLAPINTKAGDQAEEEKMKEQKKMKLRYKMKSDWKEDDDGVHGSLGNEGVRLPEESNQEGLLLGEESERSSARMRMTKALQGGDVNEMTEEDASNQHGSLRNAIKKVLY